MLAAFGTLLPIALAVAVSSVPITLTILILLSPKRNRLAIPFLIGWVVGMAVVVVVSSIGANALPIRSIRTSQKAIGIAEIIVGAGLARHCRLYLATDEGAPRPTEQVAGQRRPAGTRDGARTGPRLEPPTEGFTARGRGRSGDRGCTIDRDGRSSSSSSSTWHWRLPASQCRSSRRWCRQLGCSPASSPPGTGSTATVDTSRS